MSTPDWITRLMVYVTRDVSWLLLEGQVFFVWAGFAVGLVCHCPLCCEVAEVEVVSVGGFNFFGASSMFTSFAVVRGKFWVPIIRGVNGQHLVAWV